MRNYDLRIKAAVLAVLLLLMQASAMAHAVDHNFSEHQEWCQLLGNSDLSVTLHALDSASGEWIADTMMLLPESAVTADSYARHYASRAPPY